MDKKKIFNNKGFLIKKNFLSKKKCEEIINKLNKLKKLRKRNNFYLGDQRTEVIFNFFYEELSLLKLLSNSTIDKFMKKNLDNHYVLQANSARNTIFSKKNTRSAPGYRWHKDNKFINKISIKPNLLYSIIICLDDFNELNGATEYIPNTHKSYKKFSRIQNKKKIQKIIADQGDLIFLHGNLLHRVGKNLKPNTTRWSIFAFYTPWWIKPSINYKKLMSKYSSRLSNLDKKILHFNTTPTENSKEFSNEFKISKGVNSKKK